jgi:FlaA1/EpsC-like NDP-sugar epimerase
MGATKKIAEMLCATLSKQSKTKFAVVRFGNVLGSRGSVVPIFQEQINKREPIQITHPEMQRYFMIISEAVLLTLQAAALSQGEEIFILDMGNPIRIIDLAKKMIELAGLRPEKDISIIFTKPRSGEKLYEELLTEEEKKQVKKEKNMFIVKNKKEISLEQIKKLIRVALRGSNKDTREILKTLIPTLNQYDH